MIKFQHGGLPRLKHHQDIEDLFFEGTIYIYDTKFLFQEKVFYHSGTMPFFVPRWESIEIDDLLDILLKPN